MGWEDTRGVALCGELVASWGKVRCLLSDQAWGPRSEQWHVRAGVAHSVVSQSRHVGDRSTWGG